MKVIYVKEGGSAGYLRLGIEAEGKTYSFCVSEREYGKAGAPLTSDKLTRETFNILKEADGEYRARLYALRILSYGDNSEKQLLLKLYRKGINKDAAHKAVAEMIRLGYINSKRQIESLVKSEVNIHFSGPGKILPKLVGKGYGREEIEEVISELCESGEIDFESSKEKLLASKLPPDADELQIKKLLYRNGYSVC